MRFVGTILAATLVSYFFSWWSFAFVTVIGGMSCASDLGALVYGGTSIFVFWAGASGIIAILNQGILAQRLNVMMKFPAHGPLIFVITGLVGAVVGALSAWSGFCLFKAVFGPVRSPS